MLTFIAICLILVGALTSVFGGLVFVGSRDRRQASLFMAFCVAVGLWGIGIGLFYLAGSAEAASWYVKLYYLAAASIAYSLLLFIINYVEQPLSRLTSWLSVIPVVLVGYLVVYPGGLIELISLQPWPTVTLNRIAYTMYVLYFVSYFSLVLVIAWRHYVLKKRFAKTVDDQRLVQGIRYILIAVSTSGIFGMIFNLLLPLVGDYSLIWLGPLGSIVLVSLIFIAVVRHSLFDMKLAVSLLLGYVLFAAAVLVSFTMIFFIINGSVKGFLTITLRDYSINLIVAGICVLGYRPLRRWVDKTAERLFFKGTYDTQLVLNQFNKIIITEADLEALLHRTYAHLAKLLHPQYLYIAAIDSSMDIITSSGSTNEQLSHLSLSSKNTTLSERDKNGLEKITLQLRTSTQLVGYIVLGPKKSGELYRDKDIHLVQMVASELSVAVQSGLRYKEIESFNKTLANRVDEATLELKQSNKKLKLMDQTKDEFISLTSHQLRTPLTTVKGYLSMLMEGDVGELTPQQHRVVEEAFNSSQRMVHLISDFLNISRIQTGKFVIELTDINLADILDEEIDQLRISATSRQIKLVYDKPANFPIMPIDEGKIRQVMMNFIDNAIYYSPAESTITIVLSHTASAVEFKVIDQGIGVPKAEQHKLFAKFSRASNARKQRPDGTGIGLFMAKKVIVALSGAIIFKSEEGKGSTFGFRLNR